MSVFDAQLRIFWIFVIDCKQKATSFDGYLDLCTCLLALESAEALGSDVACHKLLRTLKIALFSSFSGID